MLHAIVVLGRGRSEGETADDYAEACAAAARFLAAAEGQAVADAISLLVANKESNGALFVADALIVLAKVRSGARLAASIPYGNA
jgi:hypothetical protein